MQALIQAFGGIINDLVVVGVGVAVLVFFWGLARFAFNSGDEQGRKEGKNRMLWGVIALFVMLSVWGLVYFINTALGIPTLIHQGWDSIPTDPLQRSV